MRRALCLILLASAAFGASPPRWDAGRAFGRIFQPVFPLFFQSIARRGAGIGSGGGGGGFTVTQVGTATNANVATTTNVTLSPNPTAGDSVVVSAGIFNCTFSGLSPTVTDNKGNTYTLRTTLASTASGTACGAFFTAPAVTTGGTFTVTLTTSVSDYIILHVYAVTGGSAAFDAAAGGTIVNSSTTVGTINLATSAASTVVFGNFSGISGVAASAGSGWTLGYTNDNVSTIVITLDDVYKSVSSASTYSPNVTWSLPQGSGYAACAVSVK
jgi:hypothetical protein